MFNTVVVRSVDLNADLAEGAVLSTADRGVLDWVTSASLACGFHAGSPAVMRATAEAALIRGVAVGAHVSYRDRDGFGRRVVEVGPARLVADIVEQCALLSDQVAAVGGGVAFVKPHGALYNRMGTDPAVASAVVDGVVRAGIPVLVAQAGTVVVRPATEAGVQVVLEGFPDRGYRADGLLADRGRPGALIGDPDDVARRAVALVEEGGVEAVDGTWIRIGVETLCIHGDAPDAAATARRVRSALEGAGVALRPFHAAGPGAVGRTML